MTPEEQKQIATVRKVFLFSLVAQSVLILAHQYKNPSADTPIKKWQEKRTIIQEAQAQSRGAVALEQALYNQYRPLVFGDSERGIKPLADLNGDGKVDEQEKANIYRIAGVEEEQIIRFGKETYYPVLTGYQMQGVWQKLSDMNVDKIIKQTKQPK